MDSTTTRRRRTSRSSRPSRWHGTRSGKKRHRSKSSDLEMSFTAIFRPGMRVYFVPLAAGIVLAVSAFLPWVIVGGVPSRGVPDTAGLWIAGLGVGAALLALLSLIT